MTTDEGPTLDVYAKAGSVTLFVLNLDTYATSEEASWLVEARLIAAERKRPWILLADTQQGWPVLGYFPTRDAAIASIS